MQVERHVDAVARIVFLTVSGDLGDRELMQLADEFQKAPDVDADYSLLIDLRQANGAGVTSAGVEALSRRPLVLAPESRRAVVVPTDLGFGMARMYELLRSEHGGAIYVFRAYEPAERWVRTGVLSR